MRRDQNHIDADILVSPREAGGEYLSRACHTDQPMAVDCKRESCVIIARLDLHESDHAPPPRDEIDFADRRSDPLRQDAPSAQAEPPCREHLGASATALGFGSVQSASFIASARVYRSRRGRPVAFATSLAAFAAGNRASASLNCSST